jgi:hypothetical protein
MEELINRIEKILNNIKNIDTIINIILMQPDIEKFIVELNQSQLHDRQEDAEGLLLPSYTPFSLMLKKEKFNNASYPTHFTLMDSGDFYNSMKLYLKKEYFTVAGNTIKKNKDLLSYSKNILGLSVDSVEVLKEKIIPLIIKAVYE